MRPSAHALPLSIVLLLAVSSALAQFDGGTAFPTGRPGEKPLIDVGGNAWLYETVRVRGERPEGEWRFTQRRFNFDTTLPLLSDDDRLWTLGIDYGVISVTTNAPFPHFPPRHREPFPSTLTNVGFSTAYSTKIDNGWTVGGSVRLGSASDRPFNSKDEFNVDINAFASIPHGERNAFIALLNYANRRTNASLNHIPLPGAAYRMAFDGGHWLLLGAPYMAGHFKPAEWLSLDASYLLIRTAKARATWHAHEDIDVFAAFAWDNDSFWRADRRNRDDAFVFYQKRLSGGVNWTLAEKVTLGLEAGYVFDQFVVEERRYRRSNDGPLNLESGAFGGLTVTLRF